MPTKVRTLRRNTLCLAAAGTVLVNAGSVAEAARPEQKEEHLFISEQYVYDDNLFRASETDITPGVAREDYSNRISLGLGNDFHLGEQTVRLKGRVYDVRFADNDYLDYTGGDASAQLDYRILTAFSGRLSGSYTRTLADFANTLGTARDLIETTNYNALLRYEIGPRWSISASGGRIETDHDLTTRQQDNIEANVGRASLDYVTPTFHAFGIEYRYVDATFPNAIVAPGSSFSSSDYEENAVLGRFTYTATVRTQIRLSGGYVERKRPDTSQGNYSGDVWRAEIDWKPREKFSTLFAAWRELRAYTDVESDYFVSDGFSLGPTWTPTEKLSFALSASYEDQEYLNTRDLTLVNAPRNDDVLSGAFTFTYKPRDALAIELSYRGSDRDSNRVQRRYDAQTAGIAVRWSVF